jgi:hypothetical protein
MLLLVGTIDDRIGELRSRVGELIRDLPPLTLDPVTVGRLRGAIGWIRPFTAADPIPPTMLPHAWHERLDLRQDRRPEPPFDAGLGNPVNGGMSFRFNRPIHVGETLTGRMTLESAEVKQSRNGPIALVTTRTTYLDAQRAIVCIADHTQIYREASA